jgi:DNA-binding NarL/FixJ family response regulator
MEPLDNQDSNEYYLLKKEAVMNTLTSQELKVLKLASTDLTNKEIAKQMCISDQTVKKHRQNIYQKLNLQGTSEIRQFLRQFANVYK